MKIQHTTDGIGRADARREITIFGIIVAALVPISIAIAVSQGVDVRRIDEAPLLGQLALYGMAFYPGLAAIIARLAPARTVRGLGWGWGDSRRYLGISYVLPLAYTALAYGIVWATGLGRFDATMLAAGSPMDEPAVVAPFIAAVFSLTVGVLPFVLLAAGEDVGWQGLLAARLAETMPPARVALWVGLAWTAFHLPLMLFVPGGIAAGVPAPYAIGTFLVGTLAMTVPMVWLRLRARSIWPAVLLHATHNAAIYLVAEPSTVDTGMTAWFAGESGIVLTLTTVAVVALWWRREQRISATVLTDARSAAIGAAALVLLLAPTGRSAAAQVASPTAGSKAAADCEVVADGLKDPRFIAVAADGAIYVTEAGVGGEELLELPGAEEDATPAAPAESGPPLARGLSGQVTRISPDGTQSVLVSGLVSYVGGVGPSGIALVDDRIWVAIGGIADSLGAEPHQTENRLIEIDPATGGIFQSIDIGAYEVAHNPDGADVNPNLYGLAAGADGQLILADAGGNALYRVDPSSGQFAHIGTVPVLTTLVGTTPEADPQAERQAVPTAIGVDPDGDLQVTLLSEAWPVDAPSVLTRAPGGDFTSLASGLSTVVGLAIGPDGATYISQLTTGFTAEGPAPGNVLRILPDGSPEVVVDGLMLPHGLAFDGEGNLYVTVNSVAFALGEPQGQVLRCPGVAA
jgi:uncharacterized protein